jgi:anti-sigma regulatory factor (Ser/Thr protein kinase)
VATHLRVGELAKELGISPARLRQMADSGAIPSERTAGGHRVFDLGAVRSTLASSATPELTAKRWQSPSWHQVLNLAGLQEDAVWRELEGELLRGRMSTEGASTASYAFTEMLNNAIDHSGSQTATVSAWATRAELRFEVRDAGSGVFPHVQHELALDDAYEALAEITKGKTTTDPSHHTGEGIFFTSKAVDLFTLESAGLCWTVDNVRQDQAVGSSEVTVGTRVRWEMDPSPTRSIADLFATYSDDDYRFNRTRTVVRLFGFGVNFVSRSEAKRLMRGLERFSEVLIDFTGVEMVGQGFVDEALRVWPSQHPETSVQPTGMTGPVEFMVRRGLPRPTNPRD